MGFFVIARHPSNRGARVHLALDVVGARVIALLNDKRRLLAGADLDDGAAGLLREFILGDEADESALKKLHWAITPEIAAAVTKLMSNKDLVLGAAKIRNVTRCRNTVGERGVLAIRTQPNHPADDPRGTPAVRARPRPPRFELCCFEL